MIYQKGDKLTSSSSQNRFDSFLSKWALEARHFKALREPVLLELKESSLEGRGIVVVVGMGIGLLGVAQADMSVWTLRLSSQ